MSHVGMPVGDGSAEADAQEIVEIDRSKPHQRWRYVCPNGHADWERTNNHIYCRTCYEVHVHEDPETDPEHYHVLDKSDHELIPWTRVEVVE
jgi:hypothetical protein